METGDVSMSIWTFLLIQSSIQTIIHKEACYARRITANIQEFFSSFRKEIKKLFKTIENPTQKTFVTERKILENCIDVHREQYIIDFVKMLAGGKDYRLSNKGDKMTR